MHIYSHFDGLFHESFEQFCLQFKSKVDYTMGKTTKYFLVCPHYLHQIQGVVGYKIEQ